VDATVTIRDCAPDGGFVTSDLVPVELMGFEVE